MSSIDTSTLVAANQFLSASIRAMDSFLMGGVRLTDTDVQQFSDLACHALLLANMLAKHSGLSLEGLSAMPLAEFPGLIKQLEGVAKS